MIFVCYEYFYHDVKAECMNIIKANSQISTPAIINDQEITIGNSVKLIRSIK